MQYNKLFLTGLLASVFFLSCESDDSGNQTPLGTYDNGVLIVNEGTASAGTITYISNDMLAIQQDVYGAENPGDGIGGYVQSIFFDGEKAFIISNGSNKITVVNRYTFELIDKIETGLQIPRYGVVLNGKAYVTNQASFESLTDDYVAVIDLETYAVESTIALQAIGEKILEANGSLYVANGTFGLGDAVTVINPGTNAIVTTIGLNISPNSFEVENGILYVLCSNYENPSRLVKIDVSTNEILDEFGFPPTLANAQNLTIENGKIYFTVNADIFSAPLNTTAISATPLFTTTATTVYGFAVENSRIYIADAKDFASDGEVSIYSAAGVLQRTFAVGLIPNGFYFND